MKHIIWHTTHENIITSTSASRHAEPNKTACWEFEDTIRSQRWRTLEKSQSRYIASTTRHTNSFTLSTRSLSLDAHMSPHTDLPVASICRASIAVTLGHDSTTGTASPANVVVHTSHSASDMSVPSRFRSASPRRNRTKQSRRWCLIPRQCSRNVVMPRLPIFTSCLQSRHRAYESRVRWSFGKPNANPQ